jgi:hypothetical protein
MEKANSAKKKRKKIKIQRIIFSLFVPPFIGILLYSFFSGFYQEPLFWLAIVFSFVKLFLFMLLLVLPYTVLMEFLGKKLIQDQKISNNILFNNIIFLAVGSSILNLYLLISDKVSIEWHFIFFLTGLSVSSVKLLLHHKEKRLCIEKE